MRIDPLLESARNQLTLSFVVHAGAKVGKTSLISTAPKPILVIDADGGGTKFLPNRRIFWDPRQGPPPQWDGTWDMCVVNAFEWSLVELVSSYLVTGHHQFASLAVDSLTELQVKCKKNMRGSDVMRIQDYGVLLARMDDVITSWRDLTQHPTNPLSVVAFITETQQRDGKYRPYLEGRIATRLPYKCDLYGYLYAEDVPNPANPLEMVSVRRMLITPTQFIDAGERVWGKLGKMVEVPQGAENLTNWLYQVYS